jgi:hypothetical protein
MRIAVASEGTARDYFALSQRPVADACWIELPVFPHDTERAERACADADPEGAVAYRLAIHRAGISLVVLEMQGRP